MDTIVNVFYQSRPAEQGAHSKPDCSFELQEFVLQDYRLIRLVISETIVKTNRRRTGGPGLPLVKPLTRLWGRVCAAVRSRLQRRRQKRERMRLREKLLQELAPLLDEQGDNALVYADSVPGDNWVRFLLPLPEFDGYLEKRWIQELLPHARHAHFVVLGNVPCLQELLCSLAPRMKDLLWIAPDMTYAEQLEEFAEDFFQEYGLAMDLHFLPDNGTYGQIRIRDERYGEPVNVLDFTGEKYVPVFNPPEGSVWLDMASVGEKERRIGARRLKCSYYSLRKIWRGLKDDTEKSGKPEEK